MGALISGVLIVISLLYEKNIIDFNLYILLFIIGPALFVTKSYGFFYLCIFVYWNSITIYFNNSPRKSHKIIAILCLILIHIISVFLFNNIFSFDFPLTIDSCIK